MTKFDSAEEPKATTWRQVRSKNEGELLLSPTRDFHDAFVRVAHLDSGTYVNGGFESIEESFASLWMHVQTQWEDTPAFELFYSEVERLEYIPGFERKGIIEATQKGCTVTLGGWKVSSKNLYFRFGTFKDLGPFPKIHHPQEVPPEMERLLPSL